MFDKINKETKVKKQKKMSIRKNTVNVRITEVEYLK